MPRFEITGRATDVFSLEQMQGALREAGAVRVNRRYAFGWRNQPHVPTFTAADDRQASRIAEAARESLRRGPAPALIPHRY